MLSYDQCSECGSEKRSFKMRNRLDSDSSSYYQSYGSYSYIHRLGRMQGVQRVIFFCTMIAVLPMILLFTPLYLRHSYFADVHYPVAESDILEMVNGASSVFCEKHTLHMNTPFYAFHAEKQPTMSKTNRRHIRLKKSMSLPDDTLEYWGFFLPSSSKVLLSVCSRYDGSRILVVKGEKNLRNCGLMQPLQPGGHMAEGQGNIVVTHDSAVHLDGEAVRDDVDQLQQNQGEDLDDLNKAVEEDDHNDKMRKIERNSRKDLERLFNEDLTEKKREKRQVPAVKLDGGIAHGGNALNHTDQETNDSSVSSFENSLLTCYDGQILLSQGFQPSRLCNSTAYLENGKHLRTEHNVLSDGYYYYIFYSDNDYVQNDIYAIFDIHKPTYLYGNYSFSCINTTSCTFPVKFWSEEIVVIEVPTRDGIENEHDDITILTSVCHPRTAVYAIFPLSIIVLILICSYV